MINLELQFCCNNSSLKEVPRGLNSKQMSLDSMIIVDLHYNLQSYLCKYQYKYKRIMQALIDTLKTSQDPQKIAHEIITYFENAFKSTEGMNEDQTYLYIDRIVKNISKNPHPQQLIFNNVVNRLKFTIKQTIRYYEEDLSKVKPAVIKSEKTLSGLFENLSLENIQRQQSGETDDSRWVKKVTLDSINNFKSEIKQYPDQLLSNLRTHLSGHSKIVLFLPSPSIISVFQTLKKELNFCCTIISQNTNVYQSKVFPVVSIQKSSGLIKQANKIFMCCNAILKNGGAICLSGGLLVALTAHHISNGVICIAPNFVLTDQYIIQQSAYAELDNPLQYSELGINALGNQQTSWTVLTKKYDYVPPQHISMVITDGGISTSGYAYKLYDKYYE